ncbi:MAG: MaoC family dehydratase [Candidatus Aminicenantes bacterium]|nr:MaoC family dehydratase [Candidatus Aminicenantes bacterium]
MLNAFIIPRRLKDLLGREIGPTEWFEMTQDRIDAFAGCAEDRQWIHIDREQAARTPLGRTVAHGFLLLSLLPHFLQKSTVFDFPFKMAVNYGLNKVRFLNAVRPGDKIRHRAVLQEIRRKGFGRLLLRIDNTVEVEGAAKPAFVAELLVMFFL